MKIIQYFLVCLSIIYAKDVFSCTNVLVTKGASKDGSNMITYSADSHVLYGELYYRPKSTSNLDTVSIYEWDTGEYLGKIKQAKETFSVVGNMNEHQLVIAETTFGGRKELQDTTAIIDYGSLIYITLQRAKTAREAISIMDGLVQEYGYYSGGESFSIADKDEVWIMEMIGKGVKLNEQGINELKGAVWVAQKLPDGAISAHANQARIAHIQFENPDEFLYSPDVIKFAKQKGYYKGSNKNFSFCDAYAPLDFGAARFCEARVWSVFRRTTTGMEKYMDHVKGHDLQNRLPLIVFPTEKLGVRDVMNLMRDYYAGTELDMTKDIGSGPYQNIVRWRPLTWKVDGKEYLNERAISTQQTGFSFVSQSRDWLPNPIGGVLWFGVDDTYSTVYTPFYCGINEIPYPVREGVGSIMEYSDSSAFWLFNQVSNFAYTRYQDIIPEIQHKQQLFEMAFEAQVKKVDAKAQKLYDLEPAELSNYLTKYSNQAMLATFNQWKKLYRYLFTKYMDGNIKESVPGQKFPKVEQPGYGEEFYRQIIKQTGDKFLYEGE